MRTLDLTLSMVSDDSTSKDTVLHKSSCRNGQHDLRLLQILHIHQLSCDMI